MAGSSCWLLQDGALFSKLDYQKIHLACYSTCTRSTREVASSSWGWLSGNWFKVWVSKACILPLSACGSSSNLLFWNTHKHNTKKLSYCRTLIICENFFHYHLRTQCLANSKSEIINDAQLSKVLLVSKWMTVWILVWGNVFRTCKIMKKTTTNNMWLTVVLCIWRQYNPSPCYQWLDYGK